MKKAMISNWYNQIPHLAQDIMLETDKNTRKHHIQESQDVSKTIDHMNLLYTWFNIWISEVHGFENFELLPIITNCCI